MYIHQSKLMVKVTVIAYIILKYFDYSPKNLNVILNL